ncbi:MAG: M24 family metallopeptidase [Pyrinomonadaceae bacterium]|nr:M24 family metallopeptidase [Pyrinomonadaceae bacterium]
MNELEEKTERLLQMLKGENLGGVLLNSQHNFAWLTGGKNNGVDLSQANGVSSLLIRNDGKRFLIANKIEMPRMLAEEVSEKDFEPIEFDWQADKINGSFVPETAQKLLDGKPLATDLFYNPNFRVVEGLIAKCRYQLTANEIERFRKLGKDAGQVLGGIFEKIETGQTEKEIANVVRYELGKFGINSVVTLVAADERIKNFRHPIPTQNVWKKNLMIVVCAKRDGLIASLSRICSVGKLSDDLRKRTDAVGQVHANIMHATRIGATGKQIFEVIKNAYSDAGFQGEETKHHQGGAAGYKTRDWVAHSESSEQVHLNQAFAFNPSITGTKSEETFLVTENGIEIITASPEFPQISNVIDGIEYLTPDILVI